MHPRTRARPAHLHAAMLPLPARAARRDEQRVVVHSVAPKRAAHRHGRQRRPRSRRRALQPAARRVRRPARPCQPPAAARPVPVVPRHEGGRAVQPAAGGTGERKRPGRSAGAAHHWLRHDVLQARVLGHRSHGRLAASGAVRPANRGVAPPAAGHARAPDGPPQPVHLQARRPLRRPRPRSSPCAARRALSVRSAPLLQLLLPAGRQPVRLRAPLVRAHRRQLGVLLHAKAAPPSHQRDGLLHLAHAARQGTRRRRAHQRRLPARRCGPQASPPRRRRCYRAAQAPPTSALPRLAASRGQGKLGPRGRGWPGAGGRPGAPRAAGALRRRAPAVGGAPWRRTDVGCTGARRPSARAAQTLPRALRRRRGARGGGWGGGGLVPGWGRGAPRRAALLAGRGLGHGRRGRGGEVRMLWAAG